MKQRYYLLLPAIAIALYVLAFGTLIHWSPSEATAAWTWNLGIALAPVLALFVQLRLARERGIPVVLALSVIAIVNTALVVGSRLGAWSSGDWQAFLNTGALPALAGKTIMGGLLLSLVLFFALKRWWRLPFDMADVLVLGLPLAAAVGRVGCLTAGCCYGIETHGAFGICYGPGTPAFEHQSALLGSAPVDGFTTPLYPVQGLFVAGNLLIFFLLWHFRKRFSQTGAIAMLGLSLLMIQRFGLEFLRDVSTNRGELGRMLAGLKWVQWQSLAIAVPALAWLVYLRFFRKNQGVGTTTAFAAPRLWTQALVLCLIIGGAYLLRPVMTLDESLIVLISCLPAFTALGYALWEERHQGRRLLAPLSLLSLGVVMLLGNPGDSISVKPGPDYWTRWFDLGAGASFGEYKREIVTTDCGGNVTSRRYEHMSTQFAGGSFSANWAKGNNHLQIELSGVAGNVNSEDSYSLEDNNNFTTFGLAGRYEGRVFGLTLGALNRIRSFETTSYGDIDKTTYWPMVGLRLGRKDKFAVDLRVFDEPSLARSTEPPVSLGARWGFNDETGDTYVRIATAASSTGGASFNVGGAFPIRGTKLHGLVSGYLGDLNFMTVGLKYRLGEHDNY